MQHDTAQTNSQTITDPMDPTRGAALQIALGQAPTVTAGQALPPFFHQIHFWDPQPPVRLGRDGHPATGLGLIPDLGLPRRMWAGGRLEFREPLIAGTPAEKTTTIDTITRKDGRTGTLGFVTLRHEITQNAQPCITEWQELVYRDEPSPDTTAPVPPRARTDEDLCRTVHFDSTLLFRYSALTFNGHRIHYDLDYARNVEGYGGLVTHGPLLAQHLMLLAQECLGRLRQFSFRATAPLVHFEAAELCWSDDGTMWVRGPDGRQCMMAQAS